MTELRPSTDTVHSPLATILQTRFAAHFEARSVACLVAHFEVRSVAHFEVRSVARFEARFVAHSAARWHDASLQCETLSSNTVHTQKFTAWHAPDEHGSSARIIRRLLIRLFDTLLPQRHQRRCRLNSFATLQENEPVYRRCNIDLPVRHSLVA